MVPNARIMGAAVLSPVFFLSMRFAVLPHEYPRLSASRYWAMGLFITVGALFCVLAREKARANAIVWIETHARTPYTWFNRLAGVFLSGLLAVVFFTISFAFPPDGDSLFWPAIFAQIAWVNVAFALVQLLPAISLDGGKALLDAFSIASQWTHLGMLTIFISGIVVSLGFLGGGVYWILQKQYAVGGWLALIGVLILVSNVIEHRQAKAKINKYAD